jgi:hypothetical protein
MRNPKAEGRSPKEIRIPNPEHRINGTLDRLTTKAKGHTMSLAFRNSDLGLLSAFGLRSSDF